jgi:hypothetical protein
MPLSLSMRRGGVVRWNARRAAGSSPPTYLKANAFVAVFAADAVEVRGVESIHRALNRAGAKSVGSLLGWPCEVSSMSDCGHEAACLY